MHNFKIPSPTIVFKNGQSEYPKNDSSQAGNEFVRIGNRIFWIDGSVILNGSVVTNSSDLAMHLPKDLGFWSPMRIAEWWSRSVKNVGALFAHDSVENWSACYPDPLGGALAFYTKGAGHQVISTDIQEISKFYSSLGQQLEKNTLFQVERVLFGNGGLNKAPFKDVQSIAPFSYLLVNAGGVREFKYPLLRDLSSLSHRELFEHLREDVLSSVNAILDYPNKQKIAHVTGGFDSRLVLSALQALGRTSEVSFFCSGPEGTTDRQIADSLTQDYKLRRVNGAGLTPAPTELMAEKLLGPLFSSGGITSSGPNGRETSIAVSAIGGGYGEVLRTFYGQRNITDANGVLDRAAVRKSFIDVDRQKASNISRPAIAALEEMLWAEFRNLSHKYENQSFLGDAHYTHSRNRYHIGQNSLLWSRVGSRFDPLYSVAGYVLASTLPQSARFANVLGFDLMQSFDRTLLEHKFDYDRFNESLLFMRRRPTQRELSFSQTPINFEVAMVPDHEETSEFVDILKMLKAEPPSFTAKERQAIIQESNRMGVNFWQLLNKKTGQDLLRASHENMPDGSIFEFFDEQYIIKLHSATTLNRQELRDLYNIGGIITWLSFG